MPRFQPFAAVRYDVDRVELADVVAPPYDVIASDEQARLEARSPYNVVRVDLSRTEGDTDRYDAARRRFEEWLAEGVLVADSEPAFYVYRMGWRGDDGRPRQTSGVLGALELDFAGTGAVLPHERTMAKPLGDRLGLMRACKANVSPIWALSLADGLSDLCQPPGPPLARCTDDDGVHHRLWRVTSPAALHAIAEVVGSAPVVIADGHHRYETALAYRAEHRAEHGDGAGSADFVLTYVVGLVDGELGVRPIHRLVTRFPGGVALLDVLSRSFDVEAAGAPSDGLPDAMAEAGALGLVLPDQAFLLRVRDEAGDGLDTVADSERLESALAAVPDVQLSFHHDVTTVLALVDKGEAQAGILLRPVTVARIAMAAAAGRRLPEKTSFFTPKPRTGIVFRLLDG